MTLFKNSASNVIKEKICLVVLCLLATISIQSCARKVSFETSTVVPSAEGKIKMKSDKNDNHTLDISVIRLADPNRLTPAMNSYVVWIDTKHNGIKNIGQLKTSSGIFSSALKSSLKATTAFEPTKVFITAESSADSQYPLGQIVLTTGGL